MADKHGLNYDVRELKLGASFTNKSASQYHTIKYDFKPASVDVNKMATVDVGTNNQVTVTVPHLDGAGTHTVFKGNQRPYTKECVLIIDRTTGEITLEKLSSNVQVKKTRQESAQKPRPLTPVTSDFTNTTARSSSRTRVATNKRTTQQTAAAAVAHQAAQAARYPGAMGAPKTPPAMVRSPTRFKTSPPQAAPWAGGGNSTLASLPMIGCFDEAPAPPAARVPERAERVPERAERVPERAERVPERAERVPERAERVPMRAERVPERAERVERVPERVERVPERVERVPERVERVPERLERVDRVDKSYHQERRERSQPQPPPPPPQQIVPQRTEEQSSSSSSSDSDSGSDSGSDSEDNDSVAVPPARTNPTQNAPLPTDVLNDDLCLSESESDSDRQ